MTKSSDRIVFDHTEVARKDRPPKKQMQTGRKRHGKRFQREIKKSNVYSLLAEGYCLDLEGEIQGVEAPKCSYCK